MGHFAPQNIQFTEEILMSKAKSFAEQIEELQATSEKVSGYEKLFSKACEINFGCNAKSIKKMLENNEEPCSNFETKMRSFFGLKTEKDIADFVAIMCTEHNLNYFKTNRKNDK